MADIIDCAQQRELAEREFFTRRARRSVISPSRFRCESCNTLIPEARRAAVPGVTLCVPCQQEEERKATAFRREYRDGIK